MSDHIENINKLVESVALEVVTIDTGDIPAMGNIMNTICDLEEKTAALEELEESPFQDLVRAVKDYFERLVLAEVQDVGPVEEGISCLQSMCRSLVNGESIDEAPSQVLASLGAGPSEKSDSSGSRTDQPPTDQSPTESTPEPVEDSGPVICGADLSDEDQQIINDFVGEALENLETIEVSLVDLEQDPEDLETINAIFRPFHTIKGVSGFLNLMKINKLAHVSENLLDKARNGELRIEGVVIDVILESVDTLKQMIEGVREGLDSGENLDMGINTAPLIQKITELNDRDESAGDQPVGEILVKQGKITPEDLEKGLEKQKEEPEKRIGEILIEEKKAGSKEVISALREQKRSSRKHVELQVKVDTKKLDNMVDLTGELVIAQSMLRQNGYVQSINDQKLLHNLNQLNQITSSLQTIAMSMRMVPIKATFQKMVRLVRDLARNAGKEVGLEMSGEDTEIDRNVVDELYEPMVHMIRNSVDHGLEGPEEREESGKERKGYVYLSAYHRGGKIVIEIEDDGRGLNRDRIIEKAKSKGLISDESKMTDSEIYNLIFQPGFSTAKEITDISGRGVGMDVVKKTIEKLRGKVEIQSTPGHGSTFVISLPLTLAIIEGMLVRVGRERYVIPALSILESFRPEQTQYSTVEGKGEMIMTRGELLPMIRLSEMFDVKGDSTNPWEGLVVAVEHEDQKMCILLDELLGKEEVVIKSLGDGLKNIKGITGGAIMGDGRVGLILDMSGLFDVARGN